MRLIMSMRTIRTTRAPSSGSTGRNVVALRTFSKIYALAGLRIGYGIAPKFIIDLLERVRAPFNVNSIAQVGAIASLGDAGQVKRSREQNKRSKEYFYAEMDAMGISYTPTQANFIWIDVQRDCKEVFTQLMERGVIVRTGAIFGWPTHIRVTTGTDEQSRRFISTLREVLAEMIIVLAPSATDADLHELLGNLKERGYGVHLSKGVEKTVIGVIGAHDDVKPMIAEQLSSLKYVERVVPILRPYKVVSRDFHPDKSIIRVGGVDIGGQKGSGYGWAVLHRERGTGA